MTEKEKELVALLYKKFDQDKELIEHLTKNAVPLTSSIESKENAVRIALLEQEVKTLTKVIGDEESGLVKSVNSLQSLITRALGGVGAVVVLAAIINFLASMFSAFRGGH